MPQDEEASYEIVDQRQGRIQLEIMLPNSKQPMQHGVRIEKAKKHPDGIQGFIEEQVQRIAARHASVDIPEEEEIEQSKTVGFDPRTRDGQAIEDKYLNEEIRHMAEEDQLPSDGASDGRGDSGQ